MIFETDESHRRIHADRTGHRKEHEGWIGGLAAAGKPAGGDAVKTGHTAPVTVRTATDGTSIVTEGPVHAGEETLELAESLPTPETVEIRPVLESASTAQGGHSVTPDRNARILINARLSSEQRSVAGASEAKRGSVRRGTQAGGTCDGRHGARPSA